MVKTMFEMNDNGEIKERKFGDCDMVVAFGLTDGEEDVGLQVAMLGETALSKTAISHALADGVLRVIENLGDSDTEKVTRLAEFAAKVDKICKHKVRVLLGTEEEN